MWGFVEVSPAELTKEIKLPFVCRVRWEGKVRVFEAPESLDCCVLSFFFRNLL